MLVNVTAISKEEKIKLLKETSEFQDKKFWKNYRQKLSDINSIVEAAKIYILENYTKVTDWSELVTKIYGYSDVTKYYRPDRSEKVQEYLARAGRNRKDDSHEIVNTITKVVYDWTDGDFSLNINDKCYQWLDHHNPHSVIDIAAYIEHCLEH